MPNISSAAKRVRQSEKSHLRNRSEKRAVGTARRHLTAAIEAGNAEEAKSQFSSFCSVLDKAVKHGTIKKNASDRYKSRAHVRINALTD